MIFNKKYFLLCLVGSLILGATAHVQAQAPVFPRIDNYGESYPIPESEEDPDRNLNYHIVIDIKANDNPEEANQSLLKVARLINLLELGKVPRKQVKIICVFQHLAAFTAMDDRRYEDKYKVANPNTPIFKALEKAGVQLFVCGQSLRARNIDAKKLNKPIKVALSAITLITTYQLKGYALLSL